ncbi:MAG TPA: hypothetical protein IAA98_03125 [Candidatus Avipropionibacterium avicola]|uniref:SGNH hydrolase-type esterase domain-containing protein n=1 Tax=Candidatus Avipropionibacterium avicola TaxID=2840701 RepID=A0A9D1KKT3_9ACTN|nr:hypothetical protein [Candidatus Avipropionibacterium avicola]
MSTRTSPRRARALLPVAVMAVLAVLATLAPVAVPAAHADPDGSDLGRPRWVGGWTAAPLGAGSSTDTEQHQGFDDQTVRNVVHLQAGGDTVRIELSNAHGEQAIHLGAVTVAVHTGGGELDEATLREVTFGGHRDAVIGEGALLVSDPVDLEVDPGTDLAVSIHLSDPTGPVTWHQNAEATSYLADSDRTGETSGDGFAEISSWFFLSEVSVLSAQSRGTVVAFGDSITEGYRSTTDANLRYPDLLNERLRSGSPGLVHSVVNEGIGGNRLLTNSFGTVRDHLSAQSRFVRDVVARPNVERVIATFGTNDLASYGGNADGEPATVDDLVRGMQNLIAQAHAHDIEIMVGTIPPFGGSSIHNDRTEQVRQDYNTWVRISGEPDAVADFDQALRDPDDPERMRAAYDSGDHVHPGDQGYQAMADAIELRWVQGRGSQPAPVEDHLILGSLEMAQPMTGGTAQPVRLPVTNRASTPVTLTVRLDLPDGWQAEPVSLELDPGQDGVAELLVTPPQEPATATLTAAVDAGSVVVLGRPTAEVATVPTAERAVWALDFGGSDTPVLEGYRGISPEDVAEDQPVRWLDGTIDWRDRGNTDDLRRDFVLSDQPGTLRLTIPAGTHRVYLLTGDSSYAGGRLVVREGDSVVADTEDKLTAGEFRWLEFDLDGGDTGREVDLTFSVSGAGTWRVNALAVLDGEVGPDRTER